MKRGGRLFFVSYALHDREVGDEFVSLLVDAGMSRESIVTSTDVIASGRWMPAWVKEHGSDAIGATSLYSYSYMDSAFSSREGGNLQNIKNYIQLVIPPYDVSMIFEPSGRLFDPTDLERIATWSASAGRSLPNWSSAKAHFLERATDLTRPRLPRSEHESIEDAAGIYEFERRCWKTSIHETGERE